MEHQARSSIKVSVDTSKPSTNSETSYHYISYLYKDNAIWELDNQKDYPIKLQSISSNGENKESWLHVLKGILRSKIEEDSLESNLFAITIDPINVKEYELKRTYTDIRGLETKLMGTAKSLFTRKSSRHKTNLSKESQKALRLKRKLEKNAEQIKEELNQLKREGLIEAVSISRRKFDYAPFISHMLEILDKKELDVEEDIHLNSTYSEVTTNTATEEDPSTLFQNNKKTAYLSLKEKTPAETSSEKRKAIPKRKATEGVVYTTTNVSIARSAPSKKEDQTLKLKSNNTLILRIPSKGLLPKKRDRKEDQDEASSGRDKKRYSLRK
ncbi:hypothetical protein K501DRAFT_267002 [Backusella circina FSU 941]|nr:hypothetical protein K501DRAFT_267002 [Backusella circina FSU 941]